MLVRQTKCKMKTMSLGLSSIRSSNFVATLDQDICFQMIIRQASRKYLHFGWGCSSIHSSVLQTINCPPGFHSCVMLMLALGHLRGLCLLHYLDDLLVIAQVVFHLHHPDPFTPIVSQSWDPDHLGEIRP